MLTDKYAPNAGLMFQPETITGINPGVTISAVAPELFAQCGLNAGGMTDFVTRGLQPRAWRYSEPWCWLRGPAPSYGTCSEPCELLLVMGQAPGSGICSGLWCRLRATGSATGSAPGQGVGQPQGRPLRCTLLPSHHQSRIFLPLNKTNHALSPSKK